MTGEPGAPLVVTEADGSAALLVPGQEGWARRPLARMAAWPAWRPGGGMLAASRLEMGTAGPESAVDLLDVEGNRLRTLYTVPRGSSPVIAPRVPHYCMWSPGGDVLSYVAVAPPGLTLFWGDTQGALTADPIAVGAPLFHAWSPDSQYLAVHAGQDLGLYSLVDHEMVEVLRGNALGFRVPAFSFDSEVLAFARPAEPGVAVCTMHPGGSEPVEVARYGGGVALAFRPGTRELTVAVTRNPESGLFDQMWLQDLGGDGSAARRIASGPFASFAWDPAGGHLALVCPTQMGDGRWSMRLLGPGGDLAAASEGVALSGDYRIMLGFFDQYGLSHRVWSPDGSRFALCGRGPGDGVPAAFGDPANYVLVWHALQGGRLEVAGRGELAFFPPPPGAVVNKG